ncbi:STAS domain-containing protein [Nonomuraea sp. NPDC049309]|uniref:STAS domain-containing protein n=1 Tax=Nonomuraea sp. NPDC049309 TaxID=3364350 RepID=UPI0037209BDC
MVVECWREDHCTVLHVVGDLDVAGAPRLRSELEQAVSTDGASDGSAAGPPRVVVDLTEVPFCDSVGLGVLVAAYNMIHNLHGRMILVVGPGMIRHLLTITHLDRHFEMSESLNAARATLGSAA